MYKNTMKLLITQLLAENSKCCSESEFVSPCPVCAAEIVCPDEVQSFRDISFSSNTVAERVDEMAANLNEQFLT
jgi:hypothetical protein